MSTHALINLRALEANLRVIRAAAANTPVLAMVKANAYGHGLATVARSLEQHGVYGFGVARAEEGATLRKQGITGPIVVFGGVESDNVQLVRAHDLQQVIHSRQDLDGCVQAVRASNASTPMQVHLELDTGMSRFGCQPAEWVDLANDIASHRELRGAGVMTHFSASFEDDDWTRAQLDRFNTLCSKATFGLRHASNSAAVFRIPAARLDLIRPGLALYGAKPHSEISHDLSPVMSVHSSIVAMRQLPADTPVSYGGKFVTKRPTLVATVAIGYGDGLMRRLSNTGHMLVRGRRCPIIGVVCMDSTMIDVTDVPSVELHDPVVILGEQHDPSDPTIADCIDADELAHWAGTISYEVLTNWSPRVPRVVMNGANYGSENPQ